MADARGSNSQVVMQKETTFNTDPVTPDVTKIYFITCGLRSVRPLLPSPTIQSNRNPSAPGQDVDDVSGPLQVELQAYMAQLLEGVFGTVVTTGAGPYVHTFKVGSVLPSYLLEVGNTDIAKYRKYTGVKVGRMNLTVSPKGLVTVDFDLVGAKEVAGTAPFDATPTDLGKTTFTGRAISTIEEGGAAIANVLSIDGLAFDNGLDSDGYYVGGGGYRGAIDESMVKVSGTLKAKFAATTLLDKALAGTESSLKIIWSLGDGLGSAGNESLELKVAELKYTYASPVVEGPNGVMVSLDFEGYYVNSSEATALQCILKNAQATI